jgi:hypothetical protein
MSYLTKYYQNLSEQLQAQVNRLQQMINEVASAETIAADGPTYRDIELPTYTPPTKEPPFTTFDPTPPWNKPWPPSGTTVTWNGETYRYDGNGMWSKQMPDGTFHIWWWGRPT